MKISGGGISPLPYAPGIANSLTKCFTTWAIWRNLQRKLIAIWGLGCQCGKKPNEQIGKRRLGKTEFGLDSGWSLLPERISDFLWNFKCGGITWPSTSTLALNTSWMQVRLETMVCKFGRNPAICLAVETICAKCLLTDDGRRAIALARGMS